jgi:hypothetical protein
VLNGQAGTWKSTRITLKSALPFQPGQHDTLRTGLPMLKSRQDTLKRHLPALKGQVTVLKRQGTFQHGKGAEPLLRYP